MNRKNVTRNAFVTSAISLLLCVSMLVGTTFAWFTDSVTSTNNTIASGNLDIDLEYRFKNDGSEEWQSVTNTTELFDDAALWEPGHTEVVYLRIVNKGTLALKYKLGLNPINEKPATNVDGQQFFLSDYINFAVIDAVDNTELDRAEVRTAANNGSPIYDAFENPLYRTGNMDAGADPVVMALAVYMPEEVGNEANYRGNAPEIKLGLNLVATQLTAEEDSFDELYDANATFPQTGTGSVKVPERNESAVEVVVRNESTNAKVATITIPAAAIADNAQDIEVKVVPTENDPNFILEDDEDAMSFNIEVTGLVENNDEYITVRLRVGNDKSGVRVYHKGVEITDPAPFLDGQGYVVFKTKSFSPFVVVYDAEYKEPVVDNTQTATATVQRYGAATANAEIDADGWKVYDNWRVSNEAQRLEEAFIFTADKTNIETNPYKDWLCDFFVSMDRDVPAGAVCLGGNYASYGWIGFENKDTEIKQGEEIDLLATAIGRDVATWTYADVYNLVKEFKCGVARTYGTDYSVLEGATLTVNLRMIDPTNHDNFVNVATVTYTFGETFGSGTYNIQ